jgi:hypothetical protein
MPKVVALEYEPRCFLPLSGYRSAIRKSWPVATLWYFFWRLTSAQVLERAWTRGRSTGDTYRLRDGPTLGDPLDPLSPTGAIEVSAGLDPSDDYTLLRIATPPIVAEPGWL